jgi:CO/xanthine dehydrogenase Mo-binding subunit
METPPIECILVENHSVDGPNGAKGVGEPPIIVPGAAIANAVTRATGRAMRELPLTPDRVLDHLRAPAERWPAATNQESQYDRAR